MSWLVIHNPSAGRPEDVGPRLRRTLDAVGVEYTIVVTESAAHLTRVVAEGVAHGYRQFAAVGGDGTAHLVLNAIDPESWESPPVLAIIAAGSGSDFIRTFALPRTLEDSARLLAKHHRTPQDYPLDGYERRRFQRLMDHDYPRFEKLVVTQPTARAWRAIASGSPHRHR